MVERELGRAKSLGLRAIASCVLLGVGTAACTPPAKEAQVNQAEIERELEPLRSSPPEERAIVAAAIAQENADAAYRLLSRTKNWKSPRIFNNKSGGGGIIGEQRFQVFSGTRPQRVGYGRHTNVVQRPVYRPTWRRVQYSWDDLRELKFSDQTGPADISGGPVDEFMVYPDWITEPSVELGFAAEFARKKDALEFQRAIEALLQTLELYAEAEASAG